MRLRDFNLLNIGPRLTLSFAFLIILILGGNALLIWQFHIARLQAHRLTAVNQQLAAVLRLQESIRSFHQRLDDVAQSRDARRLESEAAPLRKALIEYTQVPGARWRTCRLERWMPRSCRRSKQLRWRYPRNSNPSSLWPGRGIGKLCACDWPIK